MPGPIDRGSDGSRAPHGLTVPWAHVAQYALLVLAVTGTVTLVHLVGILSTTRCLPMRSVAGLERKTGLVFAPGSRLECGYYAAYIDTYVYAVVRSPGRGASVAPSGTAFVGEDPTVPPAPDFYALPGLPSPPSLGLDSEPRRCEHFGGSPALGPYGRCLTWQYDDAVRGETVTYVRWTRQR